MAFSLQDLVWETSTTTGTGAMSLAGAVSLGGITYRTFAQLYSNNDTLFYQIFNAATSEREEGIGTYTSAGNLLTRTTVLRSSNSNALVSFSAGTKQILVSPIGVVYEKLLTPASRGVPIKNGDASFIYGGVSGAALTTGSGNFTPTITGKYKIGSTGGGSGGNSANGEGGGGGGAGGTAILWDTLIAGTNYAYVVGAAGTAGTGGGFGGIGGNSTFAAPLGTITGNGGAAGATSNRYGSRGGVASGGTLNSPGGDGSPGDSDNAAFIGGNGGASVWGGGGMGGANAVGLAGRAYGSGGGGGSGISDGAAGAGGLILIEFIG